MDLQEKACASFAGGFVPVDADVVVVVTESGDCDNPVATITTTATSAPASPREAVQSVADAYGLAVDCVRANVYVLVGGADGLMLGS